MGLYNEIRDAVELYARLGFDTVPLQPGTKEAAIPGWEIRHTYQMWRNAHPEANLGIRMGGPICLAALDCDETAQPGTIQNARQWMAGLGFTPGSYPLVASASGLGRHIYLRLVGGLSNNSRILAVEFGKGEFRFGQGAYIVGPPSRVDGEVYRLLEGDFQFLPEICVRDILPILQHKEVKTEPARAKKPIPRSAFPLLQGQIPEKYRSRSEAEAALLAILVNAGHPFESVLRLFMSYPCAGKFTEIREKSEGNAIYWLQRSYEETREWTSKHENPERQAAKAQLSWAESRAWPGRAGAYDKLVYVAHASIAVRAGRLSYTASARELGDMAGVPAITAHRATRRLIQSRHLQLVKGGSADYAATYSLVLVDKSVTLPNPPSVSMCNTLALLQHDAFRGQRGLGKTAGQIWQALLEQGPQTPERLSEQTGRSKRTVLRHLYRLEQLVDGQTGEVLPLVARDGDCWRALPVDLDRIAQVLGTSGAGERQRRRHIGERLARRRGLENQWRPEEG